MMYIFNKKYGVWYKAHISGIEKHGISDQHRKTFNPCKKYQTVSLSNQNLRFQRC